MTNERDPVSASLVSQGLLSPAQIPIAGGAASVAPISGEVTADVARHAWYSLESYEAHGHQQHAGIPFPVAPLEGNQAGFPYVPYQTDRRILTTNGVSNQ